MCDPQPFCVECQLTDGAVESVGAVEALAAERSDRIDARAEILAHRLRRFRALVHVCKSGYAVK